MEDLLGKVALRIDLCPGDQSNMDGLRSLDPEGDVGSQRIVFRENESNGGLPPPLERGTSA